MNRIADTVPRVGAQAVLAVGGSWFAAPVARGGRAHHRWRRAFSTLLLVGVSLTTLSAATTRTVGGYQIDAWNVDDGLPEGSATAMAQTPDGYLWVSTYAGLVRFNGATFTTLHPRNSPQLPSGSIGNFHVDQAGRFWLSTYRGLVIREGDSWQSVKAEWGRPGGYVQTFSEHAGVLCLTGRAGGVYRAEGTRLTRLPEPPGEEGGAFGHVDHAGTIWVGKAGFFGRWDGQRWIRSEVAAEVVPNFEGLGGAREGGMWVLGGLTLRCLRDDRVVAQRVLPENTGGVARIYEDRQKTVWLCTRAKGLWKVGADGTVTQFSVAEGIANPAVRFAFEDREGNIWTGGVGSGLTRLMPIKFLNHAPPGEQRLYSVSAVAEDRSGRIILGGFERGLAEIVAPGRVAPFPGTERQAGAKSVQCLLVDRRNRIWVGYAPGGLLISSADGAAFTVQTEMNGVSIFALFEDSRGRVWIGGDQTIALYADGAFRRLEAPAGLVETRVRSFAEDPASGDVWAASLDGLFRHGAGGWQEIKDERGQPLLDISWLHAEVDGTLWIGGARRGLLRLRAGRMSEVSAAQGFQVEAVRSMLDDGLGAWWFGTNRGVVSFRKRDLERAADDPEARVQGSVFGARDGLASADCAGNASSTATRDSRGRLWFATANGLAAIEPARLRERLANFAAPVVIEEFRLEDRAGRVRFAPTKRGRPVQIPPSTHEVKISFACLSYVEPEKIRYTFRVDGHDVAERWHDVQNRRSIYLSLTSPGNYRFRVKAANSDGVWSGDEAVIAFEILPQFWQTWWFRVAVVGGAVLLAGLAYRQRVRLLRRQNADLEARVAVRTAEIAQRVGEVERLNAELESFSYSVSHDLRGPVRNITGFLELLLHRSAAGLDGEGRRFIDTAIAEARRMGQLVDGLLTLSRVSRRELGRARVDLQELVGEVRRELEPEAGARRVEWRVGELPAVNGDAVLLRQVLVNLLSNALKFTRQRDPAVIEISGHRRTSTVPPEVILEVRDNGAGFNPEHAAKLFQTFHRLHNPREFEGNGIGLATVKRIVERHGGRIWAEGKIDQGAMFSIALPDP